MVIQGIKALAHQGRLKLLRDIVEAGNSGISAGQLANKNALNFTTASAQLAMLNAANLVISERKGRQVFYKPNDVQISEILAFLIRDVCHSRAEITWPLTDIIGA